MDSTRRQWLSGWMAMAAWPEIMAAQAGGHFETLDAETAAEVEALAALIIPSTDGPGAREAGVIYCIDRALATFASDEREAYRNGMAQVQAKRTELFPASISIRALSAEQQMALMKAIETSDFFELLRTHTVLGFLGNPSYGGNREKVGWRQIGFEDRMMWEPPFGYYDAEAAKGGK